MAKKRKKSKIYVCKGIRGIQKHKIKDKKCKELKRK